MPGHIQWNLEWNPFQQWIMEHAGLGGILYGKGSNLGGWLIPSLYQVCTGWYSHTFACGEAHIEDGGSHMDRLLLDHFQQLVVILYNNMSAV